MPDSYYMQVDKLNEVIVEAGGRALDYNGYIRNCFEKAYAAQVICASDVVKIKGTKRKKIKASAENDNAESAGG